MAWAGAERADGDTGVKLDFRVRIRVVITTAVAVVLFIFLNAHEHPWAALGVAFVAIAIINWDSKQPNP